MMDFSRWESPVNIIQSQIGIEVEGEIMRAVQKVGVIVDKEELIKALRYDRGQYDKGFVNGYNKAIDDLEEKLLYQIGDLGIREIIEESAQQLKEGDKNESSIRENY